MAHDIFSTLIRISREVERSDAARKREAERTNLANARMQSLELRESEKAEIRNEKDRKRLYTDKRLSEVSESNLSLQQQIVSLNKILLHGLKHKLTVNFEDMLVKPSIPKIDFERYLKKDNPPEKIGFILKQPSRLISWIPTVRNNYLEKQKNFDFKYQQLLEEYEAREYERIQLIEDKRNQHAENIKIISAEAEIHNQSILSWQQKYLSGEHKAVTAYYLALLKSSKYPESFPKIIDISYVRESKLIGIDFNLPLFEESIPRVSSYKYTKMDDSITSIERPESERRRIYASVIAQITLRSLYEIFNADDLGLVDAIVFNGYVDTTDLGSGKKIRLCLVAIRTTSDFFAEVNLTHVDPVLCLQALKALFSRSPSELVPVRPILNLNMIDSRFVREADVISGLSQRANLMDLTPTQFESLITNLFQKMGLDTKQTQPSRDGGVDCVAFDLRPIFGGKVVIQAKRYKNTVGVSAVRDLFGTMQNEGASKGILVTTSGYGKASFEFANGKPIELLDGSNLLYLLRVHAQLDASIIMPIEWNGY